jgi:hypothetical protein
MVLSIVAITKRKVLLKLGNRIKSTKYRKLTANIVREK